MSALGIRMRPHSTAVETEHTGKTCRTVFCPCTALIRSSNRRIKARNSDSCSRDLTTSLCGDDTVTTHTLTLSPRTDVIRSGVTVALNEITKAGIPAVE